jgi:glutamyl-tRNA(Gln) amidotransferase subunit D
MYENYSPKIQSILKKNKIGLGQRILVEKGEERYEGILMPKSSGDPNCLVVKLDNGYNIGIEMRKAKIKKLQEKRELTRTKKAVNIKHDPSKPTIAVLHIGGTVASRVDYRTGGTFASFTPEDLVEMFPELTETANIRSRLVFQMHSEDIEFEHWAKMAQEVRKEIEHGCSGIIITHGTDTMHYTSAALAFMLQDLPVPVLLVGSQRSSDRGSSDAAMNLICAARFIAGSNFSGVAICMHGSMNDEFCYILPATKTRKMHTSRRDTFRPINDIPIAKIDYRTGGIEFMRTDYKERDAKRKLNLDTKFDKKIAIVRIYPGFSSKELEFYNNYHGIVLEGTGLGHAPVTALDDVTKKHTEMLKTIGKFTKKGIIIVMTSQCPYGRVNMNVYSPGRDLLKAGVMPAYMTTETAFVKLGWSLGHAKKAKELFSENLVGEMFDRIDARAFLF